MHNNQKLKNKTETNIENKNKNRLTSKSVNNNNMPDVTTHEIKLSPKNNQEIDFIRENRLAEVIQLQSKGLTQDDIAKKLGVNQSTISRDLQYLKQEGKNQIWAYMNDEILFEYLRYIVANNEISKKLWEIVQDTNPSIKEKTNALSLLNQLSVKRIEILMNGTESYKNLKRNISEIKEYDEIEKDPWSKLSAKLAEINKRFRFRKSL
jgi:transcriptional regulator with XRE-family HTH domain